MTDWQKRVWLYLDGEDDAKSAQAVRSFRSISSTTVVGLPYWTAEGVYGVRSLQETGGVEFVVDARLSGSSDEVYRSALSLFENGVAGVTLHPFIQQSGAQRAAEAARDSLSHTLKAKEPSLFFSVKAADRLGLQDFGAASLPTDQEFMQSAVRRLESCGCSAILLDKTSDFIRFKEFSEVLAAPLSPTNNRDGIADSILNVLRRKAYSALVPLSLFGHDDDVDRCVDMLQRSLALLAR